MSESLCEYCNGPRNRYNERFCSIDCAAKAATGPRDVARYRRFVELKQQGLSASKVALKYYEETGEITTRNMVIGLLNPRKNSAVYSARYRKGLSPESEAEMAATRAKRRAQRAKRRTIHELTATTCRWPIGDGPAEEFCGAKCECDKPYCDFHMGVAYQAESSLNKRKRQFKKPSNIVTGFR